MDKSSNLLRVATPCVAIILLAACGGGSSGNSPGVTTYAVSGTAGTGGSISPATATVDAGGTTQFTVTPASGYVVGGVTGCGGTLSGSTYTTGPVNANCSAGAPGELNDLWVYSPSGNEWTYVRGSTTANPTGVYGTQGLPEANNSPPPRSQAVGWTDANGNLWMFGGEGYDTSTGFYHRFNDLWEYSAGEWIWVAGSNTFDATGTYGTLTVAAAANVPGARAEPFKWQDASGNVWLFGGFQYDDSTSTRFEMNDLWKYPTQ